MTREDERLDIFSQEDHQVAYIWDGGDAPKERPSKRRRVSKQAAGQQDVTDVPSLFVPLFNGAETVECVSLRQRLYEESWATIEDRIRGILRDSNSSMLDSVSRFADESKTENLERIPSAFIVTGPNIASQGLLFAQLSETLQTSSSSKFITLRSSESTTLKAVLKKIIRDVTSKTSGDDQDDLQVGTETDSRRFLDYDLEALQAFIKPENCEHVFVAFQDSEGFDSSLLSDLIALFHSWRPRIPFNLLFGVATSVELLQSRLLKSACRLMYGAQFDCVQTGAILETVFKGAVAACDVPLRLGSSLLRGMLDRQQDHIAGIQAFITSIKYAYMCHYYANPLSVLPSPEVGHIVTLQPGHFEALRNLPSFRAHVEASVDLGTAGSLRHARSLIEDDDYLLARVQASANRRQQWVSDRLRYLLIMEAAGAQQGAFSKMYIAAMDQGFSVLEKSHFVERIRRMSGTNLKILIERVLALLEEGDDSLQLDPSTKEEDTHVQNSLRDLDAQLTGLIQKAETDKIDLRSKYSGQNKVMRTTVIAQKVQLSQDSAALREEDKQFTNIVDATTKLLSSHFDDSRPSDVLFSESWLYDSRAPSRDVFVPRPRGAFERSLSRPHDYLACACCNREKGGLQATLPATSMLYHMYQETSGLINVADLWSAFYTLVTEEGDEDERLALVMFYRGLAELRALGFVKGSKKKADHIAKVKWL